jgi:alkylation response protein AidB-like acyl-CoA dehydrogenase
MEDQPMSTRREDNSDFIEAAQALAPDIRAAADQIERERRLPQPLIQAMIKADFFRMLVPAKFGGSEVELITFLRVIEELAKGDASAAWILMNCGTFGSFAGRLDEAGAAEIFGQDPSSLIAGSGEMGGQAVEVADGFRVTGRWPRVSGIDHCTWVLGRCTVLVDGLPRVQPNGQPDIRTMFFPLTAGEVIDTWSASGLRGTSSHDFTVTEVLVPARRTMISGSWEAPPRQPGPLYQFPLLGLAASTVGPVALGLARTAIDSLVDLARHKVPRGNERRLAARPLARTSVAQAEGAYQAARAFLYATVGQIWESVVAGRTITLEQRALLRLAATQAVANAAQAIDLVYNAGGSSSLYASNPLQRCFRDIHAVTAQFVVAPTSYEVIGQALFGVDTEKLLL